MTNLSKAQIVKLGEIVAATQAGTPGFLYMTEKSVKILLDADYVECNTQMTDGNKVAVRATKSGADAYEAAQAEGAGTDETPTGETPSATNEGTRTMNAFAIDNAVPIPAIKRSGAATSIYPFDALAVGQSFFVPATEDMPNPGKSLASTVSSASKRYATENGTRTINRKNKETGEMEPVEVPAYTYERKFMVRTVEENGVKGARVWRIEVGDDDEDNSEE